MMSAGQHLGFRKQVLEMTAPSRRIIPGSEAADCRGIEDPLNTAAEALGGVG
jgi:hypothetical protein